VWENTSHAASERLRLIFVPTPLLQTQMRPFTLLQLRRPEWTGVGGRLLIFLNTLFELVDILRSKFKMV
jgi:hypothetical protein